MSNATPADQAADKRVAPWQKHPFRPEDLKSTAALLADGTGGGYALAMSDSVTLNVGTNALCNLSYTATVCGNSDFIGIYTTTSAGQGQTVTPSAYFHCKYLGSGGGTTNVTAAQGLLAIYWSYDYAKKSWKQTAYTPPLPANPQQGSSVSSTD